MSWIAVVRVGVALMWVQNASWKVPPDFGQEGGGGLYRFVGFAVEYPVFPPYSWLVENLILPGFAFFGWMVLLLEAALGAFLFAGLATRFWALVGIAQSVAITLSVLYAPHEWQWSYFLMILAHLALFATAAGRYYGVDGLFRSRWEASGTLPSRLLAVAS